MAFENIETWGMAWGYLFVVVIAGLALLVGKRKLDKRKAKAKVIDTVEKTAEPTETSPELEQVDKPEPESEPKDQANGKESEKTE